jgi:ATP-dependent exoDNAse (exonuclease V) beta subunit
LESNLNYFLDPNFVFNEELHTYTYLDNSTGKPIQTFRSVTNFLSQFKKEFNSEFIAKQVAKKKGVHHLDVLREWKQISDVALNLGTRVHKWIEDYYNGLNPQLPVNDDVFLDRVLKFKEIHNNTLHKFTPVHQEFRVFSKKWGIAGTIDSINKLNNKYYIGDWKTNKKFTSDLESDGRRQKLLYPFDDMWDNSINGYSIQLSLYRLLLQEEAGFITNGGFLVWIGPSLKPEMHKIVDLRDRLYEFLQKNNNKL